MPDISETVKAGYKTTEFYVAIGASLAGIAVALGAWSPDQASDMVQAVEKLAGAIITAVSTLGYALSRGKVKGGHER